MRRPLQLVLIASFVAACSDDVTAPEPLRIEGSYALQTINGKSLPVNLANVFGGFLIDQTGGNVELRADRTFREDDFLVTRFNDQEGQPVVENSVIAFTGTWENQDSVVTLSTTQRIVDGQPQAYTETLFGFVSGNRLTLHFESGDSLFTYVYRRD